MPDLDLQVAFLREYNLGPAETAALTFRQLEVMQAALTSPPES